MKTQALIYAFLGGAVVGMGTALLFAPEKGENLRKKICHTLRKKGIKITDEEVDALVAELSKD